jgi:hypothetical protein
MRITVADVLGCLASGISIEEFMEDLPYLERDDILLIIHSYLRTSIPNGFSVVFHSSILTKNTSGFQSFFIRIGE